MSPVDEMGFRVLGEDLFGRDIALARRLGKRAPGGEAPYTNMAITAYGSANIVAYWDCNDKSGISAIDILNGRNGVYTGVPVLASAGIGDGKTAVNFNAASEVDAYSAALASAINFNVFMFSFWMAFNDASKYADANTYFAFYFGDGTANYYYRFSKTGTGVLNLTSKRAATTKTVVAGLPTTTRWLHICAVGNTAGDVINLYINGAKEIPTSTLGVWVGTLGVQYARFGDEAPPFGNFNLPGKMAHCILGKAVPTNSTVQQLAQNVGQVVFIGDSRTSSRGWNNAAMELAFPGGDFCYGKRGVANYGVGGDTWTNITNQSATIDALLGSGKNTLVAWAGVNQPADPAAAIYAQIVAYCNARRASGWKVIICSEIDAQSNMTWHNTTWPALNALLVADHSFADGFVNLGADPRLQNALDGTYFNADKLHLVAAGNAVVRDLMYPVLAAIA